MPYKRAYSDDPVKARIFNSYRNIRQTCYNENNTLHQIYVRAGVELTCEFNSFNEYYEWVIRKLGPPPSDKHAIIRKNMMKGYTRRNLEWNTKEVQQGRQRKAVICNYQGEKMCIKAWCNKLNLSQFTVYQRRYRGEHKANRLLYQGNLHDKK